MAVSLNMPTGAMIASTTIYNTGQVGWGNAIDFCSSFCTFSGWGALVPVGYTVGDMIYYRYTGDSFRGWMNRNWGSTECDIKSWVNSIEWLNDIE